MSGKIKIKVCGMKYADNIQQLAALSPDFMGFIFYAKSPRYVADRLAPEVLEKLPNTIKKVGIFVNETTNKMKEIARLYSLDYVQLHGDEGVEQCRELQAEGFKIIKAFQMEEAFDFKILEAYKPHCELFLFDTKTKNYGGSGRTFDWSVLEKYDNEKPFLLSGGISEENIAAIGKLDKYNIHAIDINSGVEMELGLKDIEKVRRIMNLRDRI